MRMNSKMKALVNVAIAIFFALALLFFFRNTIYYHTHTRIYAEAVRTGTLPGSEREGVIVPKSAVIDGSFVYLLAESRNFGGDILLAIQYPVTVLEENGLLCAVAMHATPGTLVITAWDGELYDRCEVVTGR